MFELDSRYIVETDWLAQHLQAPELIIVDGSLHLPAEQRDPKAEFAMRHIPGAVFFDIEDIADQSSRLPHMLPSEAVFAAKMEEIGIGHNTAVVAYDNKGLFSAARVWWMLRAMGHGNVAVLNGGLPKWRSDGYPVTDEMTAVGPKRQFTPRMNPALIRNIDDIKAIVQSGGAQIVDARAAERFHGTVPEPRPGLRAGHMPGARNVPYTLLLNDNGTLKTSTEIRAAFEAAGIDIVQPAVATCGSGVTACVLALALAMIGSPDTAVYDGSWVEWGDQNSGGDVIGR
ncbi:MAG: 3-mercaptopyruvate sulfurtransferase [Pseudomonadota bacterium]